MVNTQSRVRNSVRNTFFGAVAFCLKMLLQFVVRALFIRFLAIEYLGVNGLFTNVLSILSLAELGIGNAIVYSMYKPIADGDTEKIKSLLALYKKFYLIIGAVITALGLALIPALPYLVTDAPDLNINLTIVYILFLAQTVIGYFFAYRRSLIFAYQRNDIESKVSLFTQIVLAISQILIVVLWKNFYAYVSAMVVSTTLDAILIFLISFKLFPQIRGKAQPLSQEDKHEISKNTRALFFHKIGGAVVFSTDSIIISAFISTRILGLYSNYTLVTSALASVVTLLCTALRSSIGNYIATSDKEHSLRIFNALSLVLLWFVGFLFVGMFCCFQDFIALFADGREACLDFFSVALICVSFYFTYTKGIVGAFKECTGLFWNDRYKSLVEAGVNLGLDFAFVFWIGLSGVILATVISTVLIPLWIEPYVLYKNYFKRSVKWYFLRYFVYTAVTALVCAITFFATYFLPAGSILLFLAKFAICLVLPNLLYFLVYFRTPEFRFLKDVGKSLLKKRKKEQQ